MNRYLVSYLPILALLTASVTAQQPTGVPSREPAGDSAARFGKPIGLDDADRWNSIAGVELRDDGAWVAFAVGPARGDGELIVRQTAGDTLHRVPRGGRPSFSADGAHVVFRVEPEFAAVRDHELRELVQRERVAAAKKKGEKAPKKPKDAPEKPKESHAILTVDDGTVADLPELKSFRLTAEGAPFLVMHLEPAKKEADDDKAGAEGGKPAGGEPESPEPKAEAGEPEAGKPEANEPKAAESGAGERQEPAAKPKPPKWRKDGSPLVIRDLRDGSEVRIEGVVAYGLADETGWVWYARNSKADDPDIARGLFARKLETGAEFTLVDGAAEYRGFVTDEEQTRLAYYTDRGDRAADEPQFDVHVWTFGSPAPRPVLSRGMASFPKGRVVDDGHRLDFCRDGSVLLVSIEAPEPEDLRPILGDEKVVVDVWHWQDPLLQPMQARRGARLADSSTKWAVHLDEARLVPLTRQPQESVSFLTPDGSRALVTDGERYAIEMSWDGRYVDHHVVNTLDGARTTLVERLRGSGRPSPDGRYVAWFDGRHWHCADVASGVAVNLTAAIDADFSRETDDRPEPRNADGLAGWTEGARHVVLSDGRDLWAVTPDGATATCVTDRVGVARNIDFGYVRLDREERFLPLGEKVLLSAVDLDTMAEGYWRDRIDGLGKPEPVIMKDCSFGGLRKAEAADRVVYTMTRFDLFGDLWSATLDFEQPRRLSAANPQQDEHRWGTAELVSWKSLDGEPLKGILIKPDGFDPKQEYPMMVYFYEKRSRTLHSYGGPRLSTSPSPIHYVSDGYLWFVPDINYRDGYPGESAIDCIVPGVLSLVAQGFVDEQAIGAAGHSWGGYQTAFLITRTDIFAAVESGAPVSNMTSAYGGIRWGSGMSRAFQYERTQSRIGDTLWEKPLRYLENSPLFFADKVRTPILMIHNDEDGAVPWYQGIEYFCALRRLGKEAYMLNYNGQDHGLRRRADLRDWTLRMKQFFDHHLRGVPMPAWMETGVPHHARERAARELLEPESIRLRAEIEQSEAEAAEITAEPSAGSAGAGR